METQTNVKYIRSEQTDKMKFTRKSAGLLFVGSMFIGMAAGWFFENFIMCMFAGMGLGFILMAVVYASQAAKR